MPQDLRQYQPSDQQVERTPSLPPIPPLSTENSMSEQGKQQSGLELDQVSLYQTAEPPPGTSHLNWIQMKHLSGNERGARNSRQGHTVALSFFMCRCPETTASNDPNGKQDHESEKELEIVPKKPRNETGKPVSASEPAIRRSSRTTAPRKESTTQKTGKPTESRSAEVKKKSKLRKGWVPLSDDEDDSN
ncbi:hypothetical protein B0H14DRAFT_2637259 [Mycena olivaceomarginata]|nr:hypothetical protein B0H14DRAFT_2637259 [Mycena olivaceomarginata]